MNYKEKERENIKKLFPRPISSSKSGRGLINSLINNLPFEAHLPGGYQYAGPGTNLALKLAKGVKPKNKLDEAAMYHDIAYSKSNNLSDRHAADKKLEYSAWDRVKAKDADFGEKANAWLVTNAMKVKRAIGAGMVGRRSRYTKYPVNLDSEQLHRVSTAVKPITLRINRKRSRDSIMNETYLPLTQSQIDKIKNGQSIKLSVAQLKNIKSGGFLPIAALLAAAPAVASVLGTIYNSYVNKKTNDQLVEENIRHNRAVEGKGVYMSRKPRMLSGGSVKRGKGVYMSRKPRMLSGGSVKRGKPRLLGGNGLLQELLKKKDTPLNNLDLESYAKNLHIPYFRGVFMRDNLPVKVLKRETGIVNLDSSRGNGTHWVCYSKNGNVVHYYDSFGVSPPTELLTYWGKNCTVIFNYEQSQQINQVICGHLCLKFLYENCCEV